MGYDWVDGIGAGTAVPGQQEVTGKDGVGHTWCGCHLWPLTLAEYPVEQYVEAFEHSQ